MSELYELHLARLQRDGFLDEDRWGPQTKSGKRTGDGGVAPPANGGANTSGGKGTSARFAAGKGKKGKGGKGKAKPVPPWIKDTSQPGRTARGVPKGSSPDRRQGRRGGNAKADWGTEASSTEHESYRKPRGRDNGLSRRINNAGPHDAHTDVRRGRGSGFADSHANDPRINREARRDYAGGIPKPGTGGAAGNPFTSGRSGNGYDTGRSGGGGGTPTPGNVRKRRPTRGSGGTQAGNPFVSSRSPAPTMNTGRPGNIRKGLYDYSPDQVAESIEIVTKALNGVLADYETD